MHIIDGYGNNVNADHLSAAIKGAAENATQARRKRIKVVTVCADALRLIALSVRITYADFVDQLLWHWGRSREGHLKVQGDAKLSHLCRKTSWICEDFLVQAAHEVFDDFTESD